LPRQPFKLFSNIPFHLTSAIVNRLVEAPNPPEDAYLVVQAEAAEMLLGRPRESLRSVLLKPWFEMELVHRFNRRDFRPAPQVDVVLLRLKKRGPPLVNQADRQLYRDFVVYCFTAWQPTLERALKDIFSHRQIRQVKRVSGIDLEATPTGLKFERWLRLFEYFKTNAAVQSLRTISGSEQRLRRQQSRLDKVHRTRKSRNPPPT
jgi:23S rRNA (adenine-N6)-dimethyltransferase